MIKFAIFIYDLYFSLTKLIPYGIFEELIYLRLCDDEVEVDTNDIIVDELLKRIK